MSLALQPLSPKDAIAFFRSKGLAPSFAWQDVWQEEHGKAFTVAKMMSADLLQTTRGIVDKAIAEGRTFEQFAAELAPQLQAAGWWGKQEMTDPLTGEVKRVQLGSARRLRTIFDVNLRSAYAQGNWQRIQRSKGSFPYLLYVKTSSKVPDPVHRAWAGTCLLVDDPWWDTHYPPCRWGCKCGTRSLTRSQVARERIDTTARPPAFPPVVYQNPRTGERTVMEKGIDPGFNFNIGKAPLRPLAVRPAPSLTGAPAAPAEIGQATERFLQVLDATKDRIAVDREGWPLVLGPSMLRDAANRLAVPRPDILEQLQLAALVLKDYDSVAWIWVGEPAALVRRYTKVIDNQAVTVDFSGDGTWTYHVRPQTQP